MPFVHPTATDLDTFCRFGYLSKYLPRAAYRAIDLSIRAMMMSKDA
jgi:hypothetical protein